MPYYLCLQVLLKQDALRSHYKRFFFSDFYCSKNGCFGDKGLFSTPKKAIFHYQNNKGGGFFVIIILLLPYNRVDVSSLQRKRCADPSGAQIECELFRVVK